MAAAVMWWVLISTGYGKAPSYTYFQATQAQAQARASLTAEVSTQKNLYGPYTSKAAAQAAVEGKKTTAPTPGGGGPIPAPPGILTPPSGGASNPTAGLADIGAFFQKLGDPNTWIRAAKVVVGGALLIIGLAHMTGADNAVAKVARSVPVPI